MSKRRRLSVCYGDVETRRLSMCSTVNDLRRCRNDVDCQCVMAMSKHVDCPCVAALSKRCQQCRFHIAATYWLSGDVETTLLCRLVFTGYYSNVR